MPQYGDELRTVREYAPSAKFETQGKRDANNKAIREYLASHPNS